MKRLLLMLAPAVALAQSGLHPGQLKPPAVPALLACTTVGAALKCAFARLDPSVTVTADAQGVMTIKANGSGPPVVFVTGEVPAGTVDGVNAVFTIAATPTAGSLELFRNGMLLKLGLDYTLSGTQITFGPSPLSIPEAGAVLLANYRR